MTGFFWLAQNFSVFIFEKLFTLENIRKFKLHNLCIVKNNEFGKRVDIEKLIDGFGS